LCHPKQGKGGQCTEKKGEKGREGPRAPCNSGKFYSKGGELRKKCKEGKKVKGREGRKSVARAIPPLQKDNRE